MAVFRGRRTGLGGPVSGRVHPDGGRDQAEFIVGSDHDAGVPDESREDGSGLVPGPELAAVVDVEGDFHAFGGGPLGRVLHGLAGVGAEGGRDAGQMQDPGARPQAAVHVLTVEAGTGGTGAVVVGPGDIRGALFEEHHAGVPGSVNPVPQSDPLGAQLPNDVLPVRVGADHPCPGDAVPEPGDADGHIGFGARHVHSQAAARGQRASGTQRDHRFAEGQEVDGRQPGGGRHRQLVAAARRS
jgi:hypothetical protein